MKYTNTEHAEAEMQKHILYHLVKSSSPDACKDALTIFFTGWATDANILKTIYATPQKQDDYTLLMPNDILVCYDYRGSELNISLTSHYKRIKLVAWSLGVWAADTLGKQENSRFALKVLPRLEECIAINGTTTPIDDTKGIPVSIFTGTLENLNERNLTKFRRRMCGSEYERFMNAAPKRAIENVKEELAEIFKYIQNAQLNRPVEQPLSHICWNRAVICSDDLIFAAANQSYAWAEMNVKTETVQAPHFCPGAIKSLLEF